MPAPVIEDIYPTALAALPLTNEWPELLSGWGFRINLLSLNPVSSVSTQAQAFFFYNLYWYCDCPGDMTKPLMQCLVRFRFSSCDFEPYPILNLHLAAISPTVLKDWTLPPILPPMGQGPNIP